ncbi:hypothetical protein QYE76_037628 [Lolium multiflorum]|uniref:CCHC-type domain-containing protein n=1 Tax=Lolium multiflorum TaxID=4521 RepID=A0AAD8PJH0_LOLMU|nr:hypothetical protein QYE76_037628 [Lolium multiflorum]
MGEPMALSSHPVLKIHVQHLDFMLHETRKELELTRVHNHRAQMTLAHHAEAIRMLAKDRKSLRLQRAKKDATISRLREKIRTLEVTVRTQQDQIQEMEEDGDDIQGGDDFLSDDNDFEDDEFTDEEDYEFLEAEEDGIITIDVDVDIEGLQAQVQQVPCAPGLIKKMRDEFRELKQGRMTVVEYRDRFLTLSRTGSNAIPVATKDKATITCYECGVVGHYSNECPKRLAKLAGNTAAPAQQQRRVSTGKKFAPNNPNNRNGRLFHMI